MKGQSTTGADHVSEITEAESVRQTASTTGAAAVASTSQRAKLVTPVHAGSPVPSERQAALAATPSEPEKPKAPAPPRRTAADAIYAEMLQRASSPTPPRRPSVAPQTPATTEHQQAPVASERKTPTASDRKQSPMVVASAGVLVAALVAGAYSIRSHAQPVKALQQLPATVVADDNTTSTAAREQAMPPSTPVAPKPIAPSPVPERKPSLAGEHPAAPIGATLAQTPTPSAPRKDSAAVRTNVTPARSPRPVAASDKSTRPRGPASDTPARALTSSPVAEKPAVVVIESEHRSEPEAPAAAVGPIFDLREVSEQPRIATQHAPNLPPELRSRASKEIVVVRALVSQSGRPSRITLLRRSKTGPEVDDVILASVNQWTFSPARKKGEPVNCWFNFAVQVGGTD